MCSCNCRVRGRSPTASTIQVETPLGIIAAHRIDDSSKPLVMVEQFPPTFAERAPNIDSVAEVLNFSPINIRTDIPIQSVSTSGSKLIVPINDVRNLQGLKPNFEALWSLCDDYNTTGCIRSLSLKPEKLWWLKLVSFPSGRAFPKTPRQVWQRVLYQHTVPLINLPLIMKRMVGTRLRYTKVVQSGDQVPLLPDAE